MVRGRRARTTNETVVLQATAAAAITGVQLLEDTYCASPKRKDCKIEQNGLKQNEMSTIDLSEVDGGGTRTRSQSHNIFKPESAVEKFNGLTNGSTYYNIQECNGSNLSLNFDLTDENTRDMNFSNYAKKMQNNHRISTDSTNLFLQEPVEHLDIDKSPNQPSSIKIKSTLEIEPVFSATVVFNTHLNGQFKKIVSLNTSPKRETASLISNNQYNNNNCTMLLNIDNNSCDSGVVIDTKPELSPSRRRKPTTPHRIVCPSPVKHPSVNRTRNIGSNFVGEINEISGNHSPLAKNSNCITITANHLNGALKRHPKSRRRLNPQQHENHGSIASPQLIGGVTLNNEIPKMNCNNQKLILNSAKNPTAEQNTNNNFKKHNIVQSQQQAHKTNGQQKSTAKPHQNGTGNRELTEFFPVRRSVRKTKTVVKEEMMRSIEQAILDERDEGLKVIEDFKDKGRGIIADRIFKRGEFVVEYIGDLINMTEANQRERKYALDENAGCYMYYFKHKNQQYCIDATAESGKLGRLVNHSRNGNLITKTVVVKNRPHLVLIAKDDIRPGEELTYDYGDRSKESLLHHPWLAL